MRRAKREMIHATAHMPIIAMMIETGLAMPAPLPLSDAPTIVGMKNAAAKTGPINPIDCAITSRRVRLPLPSFSPPLACAPMVSPPGITRYRVNGVPLRTVAVSFAAPSDDSCLANKKGFQFAARLDTVSRRRTRSRTADRVHSPTIPARDCFAFPDHPAHT